MIVVVHETPSAPEPGKTYCQPPGTTCATALAIPPKQIIGRSMERILFNVDVMEWTGRQYVTTKALRLQREPEIGCGFRIQSLKERNNRAASLEPGLPCQVGLSQLLK